MERVSKILSLWEENPPATGRFPSKALVHYSLFTWLIKQTVELPVRCGAWTPIWPHPVFYHGIAPALTNVIKENGFLSPALTCQLWYLDKIHSC